MLRYRYKKTFGQKSRFSRDEIYHYNKVLKRNKIKKVTLLVCVLLIISAEIIYLFFVSPLLIINKITIETGDTIKVEDVQQMVVSRFNFKKISFLSESNIFLFDINKLSNDIKTKYMVEEVKIDRVLPSTIKIVIKEKIPVVVLVSNNRIYKVDRNGLVVGLTTRIVEENATSTNSELTALSKKQSGTSTAQTINYKPQTNFTLPIIYNHSSKLQNVREYGISTDILNSIIRLKTTLDGMNMAVESFKINTEPDSTKVVTIVKLSPNRTIELYFDYNHDFAMQIDKLIAYKDKIVQSPEKTQYIDFRFGNKIFSK